MDENNHYYEEFDNMHFKTDDEAEDDAIVELVAPIFEKYIEIPKIINVERVIDAAAVEKGLREIFKDVKNVTIQSEINEEVAGFGSISITAPAAEIKRMHTFAGALLLSDGIEIFPRTDGLVQIDFGFYDTALPIGDKNKG